jgi:hypothetical protein
MLRKTNDARGYSVLSIDCEDVVDTLQLQACYSQRPH